MTKCASLLAVLLVAATPLAAADSKSSFALRGPALATCGQFLQAIEQKQENVILAGGWLEGYLTGVNQFLPQTFDIAPWQSTDSLLSLVRHNCDRNREQRFFEVVKALVEFLQQGRLKEGSERVVVEAGDKKIALYQVTVRDVQQALINRGMLQGTADGQFGPKTKTALETFQQEQKIQVTGLPDQLTLWRLLAAPASGG